jgi:hypothetical protein
MYYGKFQNSQISMRSSSRWAKNIEEILIFLKNLCNIWFIVKFHFNFGYGTKLNEFDPHVFPKVFSSSVGGGAGGEGGISLVPNVFPLSSL